MIVFCIIGVIFTLVIPTFIKKNNKFEFKNSDSINCPCK
ncbi:MAG: hypothetical protein IJ941_02575 [Clostridia bacterium]|nr:hypothetical protein [Clostridia bacterium]